VEKPPVDQAETFSLASGRHALVNDHLKGPTFFPFLFKGIHITAALQSFFACL
jgi:hypothetical protein